MSNELETLTISDLKAAADSSARTYQALIGENLGSLTLKFSMPIKQFIDMSAVGNRAVISENETFLNEFIAQRPLDSNHAKSLARYTLMGLVRSAIGDLQKDGKAISQQILELKDDLGDPPYVALQPIVANIRNINADGQEIKLQDIGANYNHTTGVYNVTLSQKHLMWVVDGQHRREGFDRVIDFLKKVTRTNRYPASGIFVGKMINGRIDLDLMPFWLSILEIAIARATVCIECHLGLDERKEQQLFYDLNSKGKRVVASLAFQYDHTDPINKFVAEDLIQGEVFPFQLSDKDTNNWDADNGSISRKDINAITSIICNGTTSSKSATPAKVNQRRDFMIKFWETIVGINNFGIPGAKKLTVAAQPVVLKAIAKLSYDLVFGHKNIVEKEDYEKLLKFISTNTLDFSHENDLWQALFFDQNEREKRFPDISNFIHVPIGANLDAGIYDKENAWVRFGSRHNDIFPRLGDLIRYHLKMKPRQSVTKAIAKDKELENVTS